jgi:N-acetylmuramidase-like protein
LIARPRLQAWANPACEPAVKPALTDAHLDSAAQSLGVAFAAVKAVCTVEAPGGGFLDSGEPVILFERHKFSEATGGRFDKSHPDISNPAAGGYGKSHAEHARLGEAVALDRDAALKSASWGKFQILGANYKDAGFGSLQGFINAMFASEADQLEAFVHFIRANPAMHQALKERDWPEFARRYNGRAYRRNNYDIKLATAYKQLGGTP